MDSADFSAGSLRISSRGTVKGGKYFAQRNHHQPLKKNSAREITLLNIELNISLFHASQTWNLLRYVNNNSSIKNKSLNKKARPALFFIFLEESIHVTYFLFIYLLICLLINCFIILFTLLLFCCLFLVYFRHDLRFCCHSYAPESDWLMKHFELCAET